MSLFFDTSALVKYFHAEAGTAQVVSLIEDPANDIWVSDLARVEFISALHHKYSTAYVPWSHPLGSFMLLTEDNWSRNFK